MAAIARDIGLFALPADAPLTPRTFNQVKAIPQRRELLLEVSMLRQVHTMPFGQLIALPQHVAPSFQGLPETKPLQNRALIYEKHRLYQ